MDAFGIFKVHPKGVSPPSGYKSIQNYLVFDIKFDIRRKEGIFTGGHITDPQFESCYCSVDNIDSVRLDLFLGFLNNTKVCDTDCRYTFLMGKHMRNTR